MPKLYRVTYRSEEGSHEGFDFHRSKADAEAAAAKWKKRKKTHEATVESISWERGVDGVVALCNEVGKHPDNG